MQAHKDARLRAAAFAAAVLLSAGTPAMGGDELIEWARARAVPLDPARPRFEALDEGIARARLVGVGESVHETATFLRYRRQLLEDLVRRHRVTALVLESGLADAMALDDYVKGRTPAIDFRAAAPGLGGMAEVDAAFEWLREWNLGPGRSSPVTIYGADLSGRAGSMVPALDRIRALAGGRPGLDAAIERVRPIALQVSGRFWRPAQEKYSGLPAEAKAELTAGVKALANLVEALPGGQDALGWARQIARTLIHHEEMLREGAYSPKLSRDVALAENTLWAVERLAAGERAVYWAHNAHIQRTAIKGPAPLPAGEFPGSGLHFDRALGTRYFAIGTAYGGVSIDRRKSVAPEDSLDAMLAGISPSPYILSLAEPRPAAVTAWLREERPMRFQGDRLQVPPGAFDALVYFDAIEPTTWTKPPP